MRIGVKAAEAASVKAAGRVRDLVPATGYRLSEPERIRPAGKAP
jgi:hypothetical protein